MDDTPVFDLRQLTHFVRVAESGSISAAARSLGLAQPALSRSVRALEVGLRAHLFRRNGRGVQLTERGERFFDHALGVLRGIEAAARSVRDEASEFEGHLAIGLTPSIGKSLVPPLVRRFVAECPGATLALAEAVSSTLYEKLLSGRLDFAVLLNASASRHVRIEPLRIEPLVLVSPARPGAAPGVSKSAGSKSVGSKSVGSAPSLPQLAALPLILPGAPHPIRSLLEAEFGALGLKVRVALEVDYFPSIIDLVGAGLGHAIVPASVIRAIGDAPGLVWCALSQPSLSTTLSLVWPARAPAGPLALLAAGMARDVLAAEPALMPELR
jgi:LysR family nitrogen assimilation transcriptional regulator